MATVDFDPSVDAGRLVNNYMQVQSLQSILSRSDSNMRTVPSLFKRLVRDECWREFMAPEDDEPTRWSAADFRAFIEHPRPKGCQTPCYVLERLIQGDEKALTAFRELTRDQPGGNRNPLGINQHTRANEVNRDFITVDQTVPPDVPVTIPIPTAPKRKRDYSREAPTGTSVSYAVRRLGKVRPDLLEKVKAGKMTPYRAMVEAGFTPRRFSVPDDPEAAARVLARRFRGERLDALIRHLAAYAAAPSDGDAEGGP